MAFIGLDLIALKNYRSNKRKPALHLAARTYSLVGFTIIFNLCILSISNGQHILHGFNADTLNKGAYLGQGPPDLVPKVYAPGLISGQGRLHSFVSFSSDLKTMLWGRIPPQIFIMRSTDSIWSQPKVATFSINGNNQSPFHAPGNKVFFASNRKGGKGSMDIWYACFDGSNFKCPRNLGNEINSEGLETHPTISDFQTLYFTGTVKGKMYERGIYCSEYSGGSYKKPQLLPYPINIVNPKTIDYTPFIAADESYLLFCSNRQNPGLELCHIYISYRSQDGSWGEPVNINQKMDFMDSSKFPYVTPDMKYLFFCSGENIYWVDAHILF